jgi:dipeptidyl-peptidase-4
MSTAMSKHLVWIAATLLLIGCKVEPLKITRTKTSVSNGLTFNYMIENVSGWDVIVEDTIWLERPKLTREVLGLLDESLQRIARALPPAAVERLRAIPIYVTDTKSGRGGVAHVHTTAAWLIANGEDERKVFAVDVCDPERLEKYLSYQRWMILNDLSLAYLGRYFTAGEKIELWDLHKRALAEGKYGILPYMNEMRRSWASSSPPAYFAEASEAYWGKNEAFPFDRKDLQEYDPKMYEFVERVWTGTRE